ncbi:MAG TPA: hypothetical protein VG317_21110 [Pseudonocardiaceae bacterium]|nr:hypothetical protein [Pseudonocardiaceae bacterium]
MIAAVITVAVIGAMTDVMTAASTGPAGTMRAATPAARTSAAMTPGDVISAVAAAIGRTGRVGRIGMIGTMAPATTAVMTAVMTAVGTANGRTGRSVVHGSIGTLRDPIEGQTRAATTATAGPTTVTPAPRGTRTSGPASQSCPSRSTPT